MSSTLRGRIIKENMPLLQKCRRWSSSSPPADVITPFLERERDREGSPHAPLRTDAKWKINKFMNFYFFEGSNSVELPDEGCTLWPRMHLVCHRSTITELFTAVLQQLHRRLAVFETQDYYRQSDVFYQNITAKYSSVLLGEIQIKTIIWPHFIYEDECHLLTPFIAFSMFNWTTSSLSNIYISHLQQFCITLSLGALYYVLLTFSAIRISLKTNQTHLQLSPQPELSSPPHDCSVLHRYKNTPTDASCMIERITSWYGTCSHKPSVMQFSVRLLCIRPAWHFLPPPPPPPASVSDSITVYPRRFHSSLSCSSTCFSYVLEF